MSITLDGLALPDDLIWVDEFEYTDVVQNQQRSLTGALLVQESTKLKGRSIQLQGDDTSGWATRATIVSLQALVDTVDNDMVLVIHGVSYTVRFNRSGGTSPVVARPIIDCTNPDAQDPYSVKVSLMTV